MIFIIGHLLFKRNNNGKSIFQVNYYLAKQYGIKKLLESISKKIAGRRDVVCEIYIMRIY